MQFVSLLHRFFEGRLTSGFDSSSAGSASEDDEGENVQQDKEDRSEPCSSASNSQPPLRDRNLLQTPRRHQDFDFAVDADANEEGLSEQDVPLAQVTQENSSQNVSSASDAKYAKPIQSAVTAVYIKEEPRSFDSIKTESSSIEVPNPNIKREHAQKGNWAKNAQGFRIRGTQSDATRSIYHAFDRGKYNTISLASMWKCTLVLKHIDACDWKLYAPGSNRPPLEDVVLVINPHHHLVDDAWRRVRTYCTARKLSAVRAKLTETEKANLLPKLQRKFAFLVIIANTREVAKRVLAAERVRLGYAAGATDAAGLKLEGVPLTPSSLPIRSSSTLTARVSVEPEVSIGDNSPMKVFEQLEVRRKLQQEASVASELRRAEAPVSNKRIVPAPPTDRMTRRKYFKDESEVCDGPSSDSATTSEVPASIRALLSAPAEANPYEANQQTREEDGEEREEQQPQSRSRISMDFTPI